MLAHASSCAFKPPVATAERITGGSCRRDPEALELHPPAPVRTRNFLLRCFARDPAQRPSFTDGIYEFQHCLEALEKENRRRHGSLFTTEDLLTRPLEEVALCVS